MGPSGLTPTVSRKNVSMAAIALPSPGESPLARLELACRLLAEARSIDEVKAIVDLAEAARVYVSTVMRSSPVAAARSPRTRS
jgi:hypothetical protein